MIIPVGAQPSGDELAHRVLRTMTAEREHLPVRDRLAFLAATAARDVERRLEHAAYLTRARGGLTARGERWVRSWRRAARDLLMTSTRAARCLHSRTVR